MNRSHNSIRTTNNYAIMKLCRSTGMVQFLNPILQRIQIMNHRIPRVTQNGMTARQPGMSVSCASSENNTKHVLNVSRHYENCNPAPAPWNPTHMLTWKIKPCDCDGMEFESSEAAFAFACERGYTQPYFKKKFAGYDR